MKPPTHSWCQHSLIQSINVLQGFQSHSQRSLSTEELPWHGESVCNTGSNQQSRACSAIGW
jgi:hypothetical protein